MKEGNTFTASMYTWLPSWRWHHTAGWSSWQLCCCGYRFPTAPLPGGMSLTCAHVSHAT